MAPVNIDLGLKNGSCATWWGLSPLSPRYMEKMPANYATRDVISPDLVLRTTLGTHNTAPILAGALCASDQYICPT